MNEIGIWSTPSGTSAALLELESEDGGVDATELPSWVSDTLKGALAGAATGAAGGPVGAIVGAATGGALAAASSVVKPAPTASVSMAGTAADANRAKIVQALQQFATVVPALVQLVAAGGQGKKESLIDNIGESFESTTDSDWGPESFQGTWTQP
jgi:hypothetical protein